MLRMILFGFVVFHILIMMTTAAFLGPYGCKCLKVVKRNEWGAQQPKEVVSIPLPVEMVFIHHTAMSPCYSIQTCSEEMRKIQDLHMITRGWYDIGYNYLVGEDGRVYEGRGWNREGAHTKGFNRDAVAISVMGDFTSREPNEKALKAVKDLISCAIENNIITENYRLYGHRDVRDTACPGNSFYKLIQTWPHYDFHKPTKEPIIG